MRFDDIDEGVAGPENCWPGYRKVGTKPGTGKNAGKRVNDCEKIKEGISDDVDSADVGEYDREGDMAQSQLKTAEDAASELRSILDADENLPEWVQSKITKAVDYLDTARDYMKSEKQGVAETKVSKYKDMGATNSTTHFIKNVTTGKIVSPHRSRQDAEDALVASMRDSNDEFKIVRARKEGVAEGQLDEISQDTARSYAQKATQSKKDLINQTYRKGADTDKLNKKIQTRQQGLNRAHTDKRYYKDEQGVAEGDDIGYHQTSGTKAGHTVSSRKLSNKPQASNSDVTLQSGSMNHSGKSYNFPKGTLFTQLPGGIFAKHPSVPETHPGYGHLIKSSEDNIRAIHNALSGEQGVTEVSTELRNRYVARASDDYGSANFAARASKSHPGLEDYSREQERRAEKRRAGLNRALSDKRTGREESVAEGGFKNLYAEFSGYGNYMQGRAVNVFKKAGLEIVSKEYTEDDDIQTYVVKGDRWGIEKAGKYLERNPEQFGGYHFVKQGAAEGTSALGQAVKEAGWGRRSYSSYHDQLRSQERGEQDAMDYSRSAFKRAELQHELGHEDDPDFERKQRQQAMDRDRGPWYIRIDGKIYRQKGEPKSFDWKKGANNYAVAMIKNNPSLQGRILLSKSAEDK